MKKFLSYNALAYSLVVFFISSLFSCSHAQTFTLTGNIKGVEQGNLVLRNIENAPHSSDSILIPIKQGKLEYTSNDIKHGIYVAEVQTGTQSMMIPYLLYVEKGKVNIQADATKPSLSVSIKGTPLNDDFDALRVQGLDSLESLLQAKFQQMNTPNSNVDMPALKKEMVDLLAKRSNIMAGYIKTHPKSMVSLGNCIMLIGTIDPAQVAVLFQSLDESIKNTQLGKQLGENLGGGKEGSMVAQTAPDFTLPTPNGKKISLSDYKGKYVLIDFWASWCGPCRKENPNVVKAYELYNPKGFEILGVSLDNDKNSWVKAIQKDHLTWGQVSDLQGWESATAELYNVKAIPANFLIDPSGKIIAENLRGEDLEMKLKEIFQ